jgi:signal transduction histidine kinase
VDVDDLRRLPLFEGTDEDDLRTLLDAGDELAFRAGDVLFRAGRPIEHWWVLLEGRIDLMRRTPAQQSVVRSMEAPGQWIGALGAWDPQARYLADGHAVRDGRVLRIALPALRPVLSARSPLADHLLHGLVGSLRHIEASLRDAESLIALGTLAAGLAHELNNPAAAVSRAVGALAEEQEALLETGRRLAAASVPVDRLEALDALRRELGSPRPGADPMALADMEESLSDWLAARGVARPWRLAPVLAGSGADAAWCERAAGVLGGALEPGLESVVGTLSATRTLSEARDAAARISGLVAAVKSYSQLDRAAVQPVDVPTGLDSTLAVLASRIPAGVTVVRDHGEDLPRIEAAGAELNQLWTQVVDNALDAMDGSGTLRVTTRADADGGIRVEIGDTGTGMPPEVLRHAFDPFFTTKPVGRGAGLGLDVARRIVERHGGRIAIDSRPGCTVVDVRLPARPPAPSS